MKTYNSLRDVIFAVLQHVIQTVVSQVDVMLREEENVIPRAIVITALSELEATRLHVWVSLIG